ncbi:MULTISPECIES: hypothetical protein [Cyanophyceae]|jgi:hypothetical protein|uniref:hypothetical protein n=1 Tax=Cyanophyceae TaxID=3028117 RepID=UPI001685C38D|nr:hypothetical protein [Trichocoleus sp. FACHB-40]MBD2003409.1 hypothetical protein [Trichocoleus sp. FACHB-40]
MSSSLEKSSENSSTWQSILGVQTIVIAGIAWAVLALLYFLLFSISAPGEDRPLWYTIGTYIFEEVAYLGAAVLCFRNWRSPQIVSGRNVWLGFGMGMLCYFLGNLLFCYWELVLHQEPIVSPGDLFFVPAYLFLGWGMILAVISRRLNLEIWQWAVVGAIAFVGIALALWLSFAPPKQSTAVSVDSLPTSSTQVANANLAKKANAYGTPTAYPATKAPAVKTAKSAQGKASATGVLAATAEPAPPPAWVISVEKLLEPLAGFLNIFYVVIDIFLLIIAATVLLAFWGGRFSQSWRMIAGAAFSYYVADMWLKYADTYIGDEYQSGGLLEVFWVFSGVLFAIGAALEFDTSSRSRRSGRKRA